MRFLLLMASVFATLFACGDLFANDTTARVSAGGIVLLKNDHIRMAHETLEISPKLIRVKYQFINESEQDIHTTVAFPTPEYGWNPGLGPSEDNIRPLRPFKIHIDGVPVPTTINRKAVIGDRDVTAQLRKIGLTDKQIFDTFGECNVEEGIDSCKFTEKQKVQIAQLSGKNGDIEIWDITGWKVAETIYWEQVFPTGRTIEVLHEYPPFVGMVYSAPYQRGYEGIGELPFAAVAGSSDLQNEACLDERTRQAIKKRIQSIASAGAKTVHVTLRDVEYILGTARNWKGQIGEFKLRVVKSTPDQFVSLCFPGKPKKISPTVIEFSHFNFVPQDRLIVHFYNIDQGVR